MAETTHGDFISPDWVEPEPEIRLVDGVWVQVVKDVPPSSSRAAGRKLPRSLREKQEWEAAEEAAKAAEEEAAAVEGEEEAAALATSEAEGAGEAAERLSEEASPDAPDDASKSGD